MYKRVGLAAGGCAVYACKEEQKLSKIFGEGVAIPSWEGRVPKILSVPSAEVGPLLLEEK